MPIFDAHAYWMDSPFTHAAATRDAVLQAMRRHDITQVGLISGLAARCDFVAGNRALAQILDPAAGLYGYAVLSADYPDDSLQEQRRYLNRADFLGAVMFGHDGHPVTVDDARDVLNAYRRFTKPMAIHAPDAAAVHAARAIAAEFPAMKFLLLGMGGDSWRTAVAVAKKHLNVYLEILRQPGLGQGRPRRRGADPAQGAVRQRLPPGRPGGHSGPGGDRPDRHPRRPRPHPVPERPGPVQCLKLDPRTTPRRARW